MQNHKTFDGMAKAVGRTVEALKAGAVADHRDYVAYDQVVTRLVRELNALWSNPADVAEAARLKADLLAAWHAAANA